MAANEDRYQKVRVRMWRGETVPRLSRDAKLLWVYLLTSPDTTMIPGLLSVLSCVAPLQILGQEVKVVAPVVLAVSPRVNAPGGGPRLLSLAL